MMSLFDYEMSRKINESGASFASMIMVAMRKADTNNFLLLCDAFPEIWEELRIRYNLPGGFLESERIANATTEVS
jgi:hypothetical protein